MKMYKVKNISNRTIELIFGETSERIAPYSIGKVHSEADWNSSIAKEQAETFEKRHEAIVIVEDNVSQSTQKEVEKSNKKKGEK